MKAYTCAIKMMGREQFALLNKCTECTFFFIPFEKSVDPQFFTHIMNQVLR